MGSGDGEGGKGEEEKKATLDKINQRSEARREKDECMTDRAKLQDRITLSFNISVYIHFIYAYFFCI